MIPFVISDDLWRRGAGGSIPSLVAYTFSVVGIFRLVRGALSRSPEPDAPARIAAWIAAIIFAANPNLIYMQTTAMGEPLYLAFFIWSVVYFSEYTRGNGKSLQKCGLCLAAACLTRYDGWFLTAAVAAAAVVLNLVNARAHRPALPSRLLARFVLISAAAPILWLAYNGVVYHNPLEFESGPYSAKAIEAKTQSSGNPGHPGSGDPLVAGMYFVKSGEFNVAENQWLQRGWILLSIAAIVGIVFERAASASSVWPLLFLFVPLPFYALSVAYGGVPIFVPSWWPFTHYNVRYGLELLPAFSVALAVIVDLVVRSQHFSWRLRFGSVLAVLAFVTASYVSIWKTGPICLEEAQINMRTRNQLETQVATWLEKLPPDSTLLMYLGDHSGAVEQAGISFRRVINEGNHRVWKQPVDPDGLWERALADPTRYADYVMAFDGDPVWKAVQGRHLPELVEIQVTGQPRGILYRAR
jgi:hypothetical protein